MNYFKKMSHHAGAVEVEQFDRTGNIYLAIVDESEGRVATGDATVALSPSQARRIAKALKKAAKRAEAAR